MKKTEDEAETTVERLQQMSLQDVLKEVSPLFCFYDHDCVSGLLVFIRDVLYFQHQQPEMIKEWAKNPQCEVLVLHELIHPNWDYSVLRDTRKYDRIERCESRRWLGLPFEGELEAVTGLLLFTKKRIAPSPFTTSIVEAFKRTASYGYKDVLEFFRSVCQQFPKDGKLKALLVSDYSRQSLLHALKVHVVLFR